MKIVKNIANVFLAITLLIATTGVTLHKHYCMGRLKAVAINEHANICMEAGEEKMPCCEDVSQELKVEEITQVGFDFNFQPDLFQIAFVQFFLLDESFPAKQEHIALRLYTPPPPEIDYQADFQVF